MPTRLLTTPVNAHIRAAWDKHPDWATLHDSIVAGAASAAKYGYPWDETAHVIHLTTIWERHMGASTTHRGGKAKAPTRLVRSARGYWGQ